MNSKFTKSTTSKYQLTVNHNLLTVTETDRQTNSLSMAVHVVCKSPCFFAFRNHVTYRPICITDEIYMYSLCKLYTK